MTRHARHFVVLLAIPLPLACAFPFAPVSTGSAATSAFDVYFSPRIRATEAIVQRFGQPRDEILVQGYSFTSAPVAKTLADAHKRGVKVSVIFDRSQWSEKYSSADFVNNAEIPPSIDAKHAVAHNKIMIIDGLTIINREAAVERVTTPPLREAFE